MSCRRQSLIVCLITFVNWLNGASYAYRYIYANRKFYTPEIQWYLFQPPSVTPNLGSGPPLLEPWHVALYCHSLLFLSYFPVTFQFALSVIVHWCDRLKCQLIVQRLLVTASFRVAATNSCKVACAGCLPAAAHVQLL